MKTAAGALLREARERQGRTNDGLAKAIGVDPATLSRIEQGKVTHPPTPDVLAAIEREVGLSPVAFLRAWGYDIPRGAQPDYGDTRLATVAAEWDALTDQERLHILDTIELSRYRRGLGPIDDMVVIVRDQSGRSVSSG